MSEGSRGEERRAPEVKVRLVLESHGVEIGTGEEWMAAEASVNGLVRRMLATHVLRPGDRLAARIVASR